MAELRIGTCSWKYGSWEGLVYSAASGVNYLEEYARRYSTVEVDQWFWSLFGEDKVSLPSPLTVDEYAGSVPGDFVFTVKVPNSVTLTHFYRKNKSDPLKPNPYFFSVELFETFLERLSPLHTRLGPLMFQFEYLNKQKMASRAQFQERLAAFTRLLPSEYQYAVEIRNPNYLGGPFLEFLKKQNLIPVFLQGYYMPSILGIFERWRDVIRGFPTVVIRLHGPNREKIEEKSSGNWSRIIEPKDDELAGVAEILMQMQSWGVNVYLNVNNHYEGSAPLTISRVQRLLD